jgi:hypothetical protein
MQDLASEFPRTPLLGSSVHKGKRKKGRGCYTPALLPLELVLDAAYRCVAAIGNTDIPS